MLIIGKFLENIKSKGKTLFIVPPPQNNFYKYFYVFFFNTFMYFSKIFIHVWLVGSLLLSYC